MTTPPPDGRWYCTQCGAEVKAVQPSFDERYATGRCDHGGKTTQKVPVVRDGKRARALAKEHAAAAARK